MAAAKLICSNNAGLRVEGVGLFVLFICVIWVYVALWRDKTAARSSSYVLMLVKLQCCLAKILS